MRIETKFNFGFIVVVPNHNSGLLRSTINSIQNNYPNAPCICVVEKNAPQQAVKQMETICRVFKGGDTITSLINTGMANGPSDWNIVVMGGSYVAENSAHRLFNFVSDTKDVIYAVMPDYDRSGKPTKLHDSFFEASLNGLTIHKDTFKKVGKFTDNPLEVSKTFWNMCALDNGCVFKGILGVKIF